MDGRCLLAIRLRPAGVFRFGDEAGGPADYWCSQVTEKVSPVDPNFEGAALVTALLVSMVSSSSGHALIGPVTPWSVASQPEKEMAPKSLSGSTLFSDGASMTHSADCSSAP
jgi:hypothetical protein